MINIDKQRLEAKLKLWETPGFDQFVEDLQKYIPEIGIKKSISAMKRNYESELKEMEPKSNYKQGKLPLC